MTISVQISNQGSPQDKALQVTLVDGDTTEPVATLSMYQSTSVTLYDARKVTLEEVAVKAEPPAGSEAHPAVTEDTTDRTK